MKKTIFYTAAKEGIKAYARKVEGYKFDYEGFHFGCYQSGDCWFCIELNTGLAVLSGKKLFDVQLDRVMLSVNTDDPRLEQNDIKRAAVENLKQIYNSYRYQIFCDRFSDLLRKAKAI